MPAKKKKYQPNQIVSTNPSPIHILYEETIVTDDGGTIYRVHEIAFQGDDGMEIWRRLPGTDECEENWIRISVL